METLASDWKIKARNIAVFKNGKKEDSENSSPLRLASVQRKGMKQNPSGRWLHTRKCDLEQPAQIYHRKKHA